MTRQIPAHLVADFAEAYATVLDISRGTRISSLRSHAQEIEKYVALEKRLGIDMFSRPFIKAARETAINSDARRRAAYRELFSA
tara:strand:- start:1398 stop:1649 length:252 start_codon:yes stop_codon:yes gene_type:complete